MLTQNGRSPSPDSPVYAPVHNGSSLGAILRLLMLIVIGAAAIFFLVGAVREGSLEGMVVMGLALGAVAVSVPFLVGDWWLTKQS